MIRSRIEFCGDTIPPIGKPTIVGIGLKRWRGLSCLFQIKKDHTIGTETTQLPTDIFWPGKDKKYGAWAELLISLAQEVLITAKEYSLPFSQLSDDFKARLAGAGLEINVDGENWTVGLQGDYFKGKLTERWLTFNIYQGVKEIYFDTQTLNLIGMVEDDSEGGIGIRLVIVRGAVPNQISN